MSTSDVWQERCARARLHHYSPSKNSGDLFGKHEGSVAISTWGSGSRWTATTTTPTGARR